MRLEPDQCSLSNLPRRPSLPAKVHVQEMVRGRVTPFGKEPRLASQPNVNGTLDRQRWRGTPILVYLFILLMLLPLTPAIGAPLDTVVRIVGLDKEGNPQRQGMGVVLMKDGLILTSAALLAPYPGAIVMTADGTKYQILQVSQRNFFQDLALARVEAESLPVASLGIRNIGAYELVWVVVRKNPPVLKEVRIAKVLPFSPRMVLLKLDLGDLETDLGTPVFTGQGELVGMLHAFAQKQGKPFQFFLARNRSHLPAEKPARRGEYQGWTGENPSWTGEIDEERSAKACGAFWEGVAASLRQSWTEARDNFSTSLGLSQSLPEAYYGRGVAHYHLANYGGAIQDLERAALGLHNYALAFLWIGKAWIRQGREEAACAAYQKAVAADPSLSEAWFELGVASFRQGDLTHAQEYLEKCGDDFPQAAQRWLELGKIAQVQRQPEKALEDFQKARELDSNLFPAYFEAGKLLIDLGKPRLAAPLLAKVVENNPGWPQARYHLALAYVMSSNPAGAWEQYFFLQKIDLKMAMQLANFLEQMR
jgi:tetratricopeptide (TPR) repeat protein